MDEYTFQFCPAVCTSQTYISINIVGIVFGVAALAIVLLRNRLSKNVFLALFGVLVALFLVSIVDTSGTACGSGCSPNGTFFGGFKFAPKWFSVVEELLMNMYYYARNLFLIQHS